MWTDREMLEALHCRDAHGLTALETAQRLTSDFGKPITRGQVIGVTSRVSTESAQVECQCAKPENKDGGMPARWWDR